MSKCQYKGCGQEAIYPCYQFYNNLTKKWCWFCDEHERLVAESENSALRKLFPDRLFKEVK